LGSSVRCTPRSSTSSLFPYTTLFLSALAISGWGLRCINRGDLNLGSLGVDIGWGWGNQTLFLQGDQISLDQNVDGATLVGWVIRDSDGFALNAVEGVMILPKQCQRNDFGGHDWGQIRVVADVVLSQEL